MARPTDDSYELYPETSFTPRKVGRPRMEYTNEWGDMICEMLVSGASLKAICSSDDMPSIPTVYKWLREHEEFADKYARARQDQQDTYADEITFIADTEPDPQRARVRIDARKWHASKLAPKKYGEKIEQHVTGEVKYTKVENVIVDPKRSET